MFLYNEMEWKNTKFYCIFVSLLHNRTRFMYPELFCLFFLISLSKVIYIKKGHRQSTTLTPTCPLNLWKNLFLPLFLNICITLVCKSQQRTITFLLLHRCFNNNIHGTAIEPSFGNIIIKE